MTKKFGFTLAEVLITLGIIGVVAAMTIPTLIANTNSAKFRSQFKKSISTLNQAGLMGQAQYDFDYAGAVNVCGEKPAEEKPTSDLSFCALLNGTLTGQSFVSDLTKLTHSGGNYEIKSTLNITTEKLGSYYAYQMADGSLVAFPKTAAGCTLEIGTVLNGEQVGEGKPLAKCVGFIDVNGTTLPNKEVTCKAGTATLDPSKTCEVPNTAANMTDIFPVVFHDATVEPATDAAKFVLTTSK